MSLNDLSPAEQQRVIRFAKELALCLRRIINHEEVEIQNTSPREKNVEEKDTDDDA